MKFVVIVDVYGNCFVFEVVFFDIVVFGIGEVVNFGDYVSGFFEVVVMVDFLMECGFFLVCGD